MFDIFLCIWYTIFMKKDMFTINKNGLSYGRGYVYSLQYHLVWCTKYRKKVLKDGIDLECKKMLQDLAEEYRFQILAMVISLKYGREVQVMKSIYHCILHSNSLSNEMDKSLLEVRGLPINIL